MPPGTLLRQEVTKVAARLFLDRGNLSDPLGAMSQLLRDSERQRVPPGRFTSRITQCGPHL